MTDTIHPGPPQDAIQGLGVRLRQSFPSCRVHLCSVHGPTGDVVWLSEGFLGPDENDAVLRAYEQFAARNSPPFVAHELGDRRSAVVLACRASRKHFGGSVLVVVDTEGLRQMPRRAVHRRARRQTSRGTGAAPRPTGRGSHRRNARGGRRARSHRHQRDRHWPRINLPIRATEVDAGVDRLLAALRRTPLSLYARPIAALKDGNAARHYEVLIRSGDGATAAPHTMLARATKPGSPQ